VELLQQLVEAVAGFAESPYAIWILFILAFAESSFFPIPPDVLMIPLALANPAAALLYALVTTVGSVTGGMFGFWIGARGGRPVLKRFISQKKIDAAKKLYKRYDVWAVGIAAFTPIPYKVFTISAGVFELRFKRFVLASILGRAGRFFLVGILISIFGPIIKSFLDSYFEIVMIAFAVLLIGGFWVMAWIGRRKAKETA